MTAESMQRGDDELFDEFGLWEGRVERGWVVNFLGVRTRTEFFETNEGARSRWVETERPPQDEDYVAWVDLLEAVKESKHIVTVAELGAGWGRWLANAAAVARRIGREFRLVGVEPEPTHFRWMQQHLADNEIPGSAATLHESAVWTNEGWVQFHVGAPRSWYGQAIAEASPDQSPPTWSDRIKVRLAAAPWHLRTLAVVPAITVERALQDVERVDFLHVDIQGAEAKVLSSAAEPLTQKVKRAHVRTHGADVERRLRTFFMSLGWESRHDYPSLATSDTPWGEIAFQDGVQTWVNPRL